MKFLKFSILASLLASPLLAGAQYLQATDGIISQIDQIVGAYLIPIAFTLAIFFFFWGVAMYVRSEGSGKSEGKKIMIWGVVALFVISSVWGLVYFIRGELGLKSQDTINMPKINY